jgi:hypothetical protein
VYKNFLRKKTCFLIWCPSCKALLIWFDSIHALRWHCLLYLMASFRIIWPPHLSSFPRNPLSGLLRTSFKTWYPSFFRFCFVSPPAHDLFSFVSSCLF